MRKTRCGTLQWLVAIISCCVCAQAAGADADAAWTAYVNRFLTSYFELHPERAIYVGHHQYDGRLPDLSRAGIARDIAFLQGQRREAAADDPVALSERHRVEHAHVLALIDEQLFWLVSLQAPFSNPSYYEAALSRSANVYVIREYAAPAVRMRGYVAYAKAIPHAIEQIRGNLRAPLPRPYVNLGKTLFGGLAVFYEQYAPAAFASVKDERLWAEFSKANAGAIAAARDMEAWFEAQRETARDDFALGDALFSGMLGASEGIDIPLNRLEQIGRDDLAHNLAALESACADFASGQSVRDCVATVQAHKPEDGAVEAARRQLVEIKNLVVASQLITIPADENAQVAETPPQMRYNAAFLFPRGAYETTGSPAIYFVSPPDPAWSEADRKAYLMDVAALRDVSVHEVWPGHFVQSLYRRRGSSDLAKVFLNNCSLEGWAHYAEELMMDGASDGGAENRIGQLQQALMRDVRFLSAIGLHTGRMTVADSERLFREAAFVDSATARQQAARGTFDPAYLDYTLGKLMIRKLRDDWSATRGGRSAWREFHDKFLSYGACPLGACCDARSRWRAAALRCRAIQGTSSLGMICWHPLRLPSPQSPARPHQARCGRCLPPRSVRVPAGE
jgi:uncharacterized protein (DUF885 family)